MYKARLIYRNQITHSAQKLIDFTQKHPRVTGSQEGQRRLSGTTWGWPRAVDMGMPGEATGLVTSSGQKTPRRSDPEV